MKAFGGLRDKPACEAVAIHVGHLGLRLGEFRQVVHGAAALAQMFGLPNLFCQLLGLGNGINFHNPGEAGRRKLGDVKLET